MPDTAGCPNECHGQPIPCWSPGGPCPPGRDGCEMCGECAYCRNDSAETVWVDVTNPDGVTFPAVLGKFHKAGVVTFFVLPEDCPLGEDPYERCEWTKPRPTLSGGDPTTRVYRVVRRG